MKLDELKSHCEKALYHQKDIGLSGNAMISLQLPENRKCPQKRRIFGRSGPYGHVVAFGFDGYDTILFDAKEVLDFIISVESK